MTIVRVYLPAIVLAVWAVLAAFGMEGRGATVAMLTVMMIAVAIHSSELHGPRRRDGR